MRYRCASNCLSRNLVYWKRFKPVRSEKYFHAKIDLFAVDHQKTSSGNNSGKTDTNKLEKKTTRSMGKTSHEKRFATNMKQK